MHSCCQIALAARVATSHCCALWSGHSNQPPLTKTKSMAFACDRGKKLGVKLMQALQVFPVRRMHAHSITPRIPPCSPPSQLPPSGTPPASLPACIENHLFISPSLHSWSIAGPNERALRPTSALASRFFPLSRHRGAISCYIKAPKAWLRREPPRPFPPGEGEGETQAGPDGGCSLFAR